MQPLTIPPYLLQLLQSQLSGPAAATEHLPVQRPLGLLAYMDATQDDPDEAAVAKSHSCASGMCSSSRMTKLGESLPALNGLSPFPRKACLKACEKGGAALEHFCRTLPHPMLKAGCWGLMHVGKEACKNWCRWHTPDQDE
jgi:hypothetical protein